MILECHFLRKDFQRGSIGFTAVEDVDFSVAAGECITITGKSGSGKTTLVTMLAGLLTPTGGCVRYEGQDIYSLSDRALSLLRGRNIGFVPQGTSLLSSFTVVDNIRMSQAFCRDGSASAAERAEFLLDAMGMSALSQAMPSSLSGGELRRVAIARALFHAPDVLLADEPTSDLDPENTQIVMAMLQNINTQGTALIVVTHEESVAAHGRKRFAMESGRLRAMVF